STSACVTTAIRTQVNPQAWCFPIGYPTQDPDSRSEPSRCLVHRLVSRASSLDRRYCAIAMSQGASASHFLERGLESVRQATWDPPLHGKWSLDRGMER